MENVGRVTISNKIMRLIWNVVYIFLFRPFGSRFFRLWRIFLLKIFGAQVTWRSSIYASTKIWAPWNLIMEDNAGIGPNVIVYNQADVKICENAKISQFSFLCTAGHDTGELNTAYSGLIVGPIIIKKNAWIGAKTFIGMDVTIGEGAIVGAAACVFKDVEPMTIVGGNPAKIIKKRELK